MRASLASVLILLLLAFCSAGAQEADLHERLPDDLRLLRERVEALERTVGELRASLRGIEGAAAERISSKDLPALVQDRRGANLAALAKIKLADNPTREDLEQYVREIIRASRAQNHYASWDPQIPMLVRLGPKNADLLIELWDDSMTSYFEPALCQLAREEHKQKVIDWLSIHPTLVKVVMNKGWEREAREVLVKRLRDRPNYLPHEWIDAVVRVRDPETFPMLVDYFVEGLNRRWTYNAIRSLPGIDLDRAVADAWKVENSGVPYQREELAPIAMAHGHLDAVAVVFSMLGATHEFQVNEARKAILLHTSASGTNDELKAWYEENRERLVWSKERRRFAAPGEE